jgi:hypothetical protein
MSKPLTGLQSLTILIQTPPTDGDAEEEEISDDGEAEDFADYDSEPEMDPHGRADGSGVDPYAGQRFPRTSYH